MKRESLLIGGVISAMDEDKKKSDDDSIGHDELCTQEVADGNKENDCDTMKTSQKNLSSDKEDELLESAKAEMGEVMEENQRLKMYLERIMKDYRTLQTQFQGIVQKQGEKFPISTTNNNDDNNTHQETEESDLISLSLGRNSSDMKREELQKMCGKDKVDEGDDPKEALTLGLDCKSEGTNIVRTELNLDLENSSDEVMEENGETWPPSKVLKTKRSGEDEVSQQNPTKRARVSVRVRCDAPTMNDGCQWRKYGQKIAKGNPCPRAYYRCTVAPSCPVRKQVQRCANDMSILTTTYEGTHNHPLPLSATAMASTTSAAASMLLSGSSTSTSTSSSVPPGTTAAPAATTNILNLGDPSRPKPIYIPTLGHPTVILDLTTPNALSSSSSNLNRILGNFPPKFSSTNLNFSSLESNPLPISWNYATRQPYNDKNHIINSSLSFGRQQQQPQDNQIIFQSYLSKNNLNNNSNNVPSQSLQQETIVAATKAITSDPNFKSALAAALTSIIGTNTNNAGNSLNLGNHWLAEKLSQNSSKVVAEPFPILSSFTSSTPNPNKCSSSLLSRQATTTSATTDPHHGNLMYNNNLQQTSKSKPSSPGDS